MLNMERDLNRFLSPQAEDYDRALAEVKAGRKESHWMWYIFPQLRGLGQSHISWYYGVENLQEARDYLAHPVLGLRLEEITQSLLCQPERSARTIFGFPDCLKLRSSMTLFTLAAGGGIYAQVLDEFFDGSRDETTIHMLGNGK